LRIRWIGLAGLLFLMLVTVSQLVLAESGQNTSSNNLSDNIALPIEVNASALASEQVDIQGIWKVSLGNNDITMAINQSDDSIFGNCKFEGDLPWNGVFTGTISGKAVNMAIAALQGEVLVSTEMNGTVSSDVFQGSYESYDSNGKEVKGELSATKISPDVVGYTPVKIKVAQTVTTSQASGIVQKNQMSTDQQDQAKSRIKDVKDLAKGIDPNIMPRSAPL
jgi:hypothetical protein